MCFNRTVVPCGYARLQVGCYLFGGKFMYLICADTDVTKVSVLFFLNKVSRPENTCGQHIDFPVRVCFASACRLED